MSVIRFSSRCAPLLLPHGVEVVDSVMLSFKIGDNLYVLVSIRAQFTSSVTEPDCPEETAVLN
jgi:hypothetical protein